MNQRPVYIIVLYRKTQRMAVGMEMVVVFVAIIQVLKLKIQQLPEI